MCKPSAEMRQATDSANKFADTLRGQAVEVFGDDNSVFKEIHAANEPIIRGGPNQHGFSQDELNARNAEVMTNNANLYRRVGGATREGMAGIGGGDTVSGAGVTAGANLAVAQAVAGHTAEELSRVRQEDWATGRENFYRSTDAVDKATGVFNNVPGIAGQATDAGKLALDSQAQMDAQAGWWKAPVMGLISGGVGMVTNGLSNIASGKLFNGGTRS